MNQSYMWIAVFKDKTNISQFNEDGTENLFKLVQDRFDELEFFILKHLTKELVFVVDLNRGFIYQNENTESVLDVDEKKNTRLIYFRRNQMDVNQSGGIIETRQWQILGLQWNDNENKNHKIILQIDSNGNFIIGA